MDGDTSENSESILDGALSRRGLLATGAVGAVTLAGCARSVEDETLPTAVDWAPDEFDEPVTGSVEVEVLVHNAGSPGDVEITLDAIDLDKDGGLTNSVTFTESFGRDEQRWVTGEIDPGPRADGVVAEANAV